MATFLPVPAMDVVFSYLDPVSMGKMAQVSTTWRDLVYRNEPWLRFEFVIRPEASALFVDSNEIPCDAHHIGEPTKYCFLGWAQQTRTPGLPAALVQTADPKKYVERLYRYWIHLKKPCVHVTHHHAPYITNCAEIWKGLAERDKKRVTLRLATVLNYKDTNAYDAWLLAQRSHLSPSRIMTPNPAELTESQKQDPFLVVKYKTQKMICEREQLLKDKCTALIEKLDSSRRAVSRRGKLYFEANERRFSANAESLWDASSFSLPAQKDPQHAAHALESSN